MFFTQACGRCGGGLWRESCGALVSGKTCHWLFRTCLLRGWSPRFNPTIIKPQKELGIYWWFSFCNPILIKKMDGVLLGLPQNRHHEGRSVCRKANPRAHHSIQFQTFNMWNIWRGIGHLHTTIYIHLPLWSTAIHVDLLHIDFQ